MNIIQAGNISSLTSASSINRSLPKGTYDIQVDQHGNIVMHHRPPFSLPDKIYGGCDEFSSRCLKTFKSLNKGMAILLSGPKGCGKTLTAKKISIDADMPVLCVTAALAGMGFTSFLTDLPNPCIIFIDEFEKIYNDREVRNSFLSLLDGASDNRHLFVLTSNEPSIGEYFINRPGRVRYHRRYTELPEKVLMEMIADKMPAGPIRKSVEKLVKELGSISADALVSLISECLIHQEVPSAFISYFNLETELSGAYDVTIKTNGYRVKPGVKATAKNMATAFRDAVVEDGLDYARQYYAAGEKNCVVVEETWTARSCYPFPRENPNDPQNRKGITAEVNYAEKMGSKSSRRFCFQQHNIEKMERRDGEILFTLKDGTRYHFQKAKPVEYLNIRG